MEESPPTVTPSALLEYGPEQLQQQADSTRHLEILVDDCKHHALFHGVQFRQLESVSIDASEDNNNARLLEPYLQPSLKSFQFYGGMLSDGFLEKLRARDSPTTSQVLFNSNSQHSEMPTARRSSYRQSPRFHNA
jgi:hypothetical protein